MGLNLTARILFQQKIIHGQDFDKYSVSHHNLRKKQIVLYMCSSVLLLRSASWEFNVIKTG